MHLRHQLWKKISCFGFTGQNISLRYVASVKHFVFTGHNTEQLVPSGLQSPCKELISLSLHRPPQHAVHFNLAALAQRWGNCLSLSCLCVHPSFLFPLCYSGLLPYLSLPSIQSSIFVCLCLSDLLACSHTPFIAMPGTSDCSSLSRAAEGAGQQLTLWSDGWKYYRMNTFCKARELDYISINVFLKESSVCLPFSLIHESYPDILQVKGEILLHFQDTCQLHNCHMCSKQITLY